MHRGHKTTTQSCWTSPSHQWGRSAVQGRILKAPPLLPNAAEATHIHEGMHACP